MKKIYKYLLMTVVASSTMFYSCDTLEMEDLTDPNSLSPDLADADLLLNNIQVSYLSAMQDMQSNGAQLGRISNMFGRNYYNNFGSGTVSTAWYQLYASMMPDIAAIEGLNTEGLLDFHMGVSKIMQSHIMMGLVDSLGDIPWSQARPERLLRSKPKTPSRPSDRAHGTWPTTLPCPWFTLVTNKVSDSHLTTVRLTANSR
jgi:hypothetical protein